MPITRMSASWASLRTRLRCLAFLAALGCSDGGDDPSADAGIDSGVDVVAPDPKSCPQRGGDGALCALDELTLLPADALGVAAGFDLAGAVSASSSAVGCGFDDLKNRYGDAGVDNQLAKILKLLPSQVGATLPGALATAISAGGLTMLLEEVGGGSLASGGHPKAMVIRKGSGKPLLGADGKLLRSQSFGLEPDPVLAIVDPLTPDGAGARGGPQLVKFRMLFISTHLGFDLHNARIRVEPDGKGGIRGEIGGIVTMEDLMGLIGLLGGCDQPLNDQLSELAPVFADSRLRAGGPCSAFSMGFSFHGVPAYLLESTP